MFDTTARKKLGENLWWNVKDLFAFIPVHINTCDKRRDFVDDTLSFFRLVDADNVSVEELYLYCKKWDLSMEAMFEDREEVN